ncbi:MAG: hypothetical protein U0746_07795 [Gemmataceae bacterium]
MIGLSSRPARRSVGALASRLLVTHLETRDCPAAPAVALSVLPIGGNQVLISGFVSDEAPDRSVVKVGGVADYSIVPDASGSFTQFATVSGTGYVTAQVFDNEGMKSDLVSSLFAAANLKNRPPVIQNFAAVEEGGVWTISGHVADEHPAGLKVTLRSSIPQLNNRVVTTDENGNFEFRFTEPMNFFGGSVSAQTTDDQGVDSQVVYTFVG